MDNKWIKIFEELHDVETDIPLESSNRDLEKFEDDRVWRDIKDQLMYALVAARNSLEELGEGVDRNEISYLQGQCYAIRHLLTMPTTLINSIKKESEEEPDESQGSDE